MKITSIDIWTVVVPTIPGRVHSPECVARDRVGSRCPSTLCA